MSEAADYHRVISLLVGILSDLNFEWEQVREKLEERGYCGDCYLRDSCTCEKGADEEESESEEGEDEEEEEEEDKEAEKDVNKKRKIDETNE
jgi:hypothetical protein